LSAACNQSVEDLSLTTIIDYVKVYSSGTASLAGHWDKCLLKFHLVLLNFHIPVMLLTRIAAVVEYRVGFSDAPDFCTARAVAFVKQLQ